MKIGKRNPLSKKPHFEVKFGKIAYIFAMKRKILPTGRQKFRRLREENCIYVDKTQHIYNLSIEGVSYFLSHPRRFGKSLLLSTLKELFLGSKELFEDTWIADKWDWTQKSPIVDISFLSVAYESKGLEAGLRQYLNKIYKTYKIDNQEETDIKLLFTNLIEQLYRLYGKVVILINEYDKPILDYMEFNKMEQAKANQEIQQCQ